MQGAIQVLGFTFLQSTVCLSMCAYSTILTSMAEVWITDSWAPAGKGKRGHLPSSGNVVKCCFCALVVHRNAQ